MILEFLISGATLVGCMSCWAIVAKHKLSVELQKHKITTDYESIKPMPEPPPPKKEPTIAQQVLDSQKKTLEALLERRKALEVHINNLRNVTADGRYSDKSYNQWRENTVTALNDARKEQQELVREQADLIGRMQGANNENTATEPVRIDSGVDLAERMVDLGSLHDVELHDEETSRKGAS